MQKYDVYLSVWLFFSVALFSQSLIMCSNNNKYIRVER